MKIFVQTFVLCGLSIVLLNFTGPLKSASAAPIESAKQVSFDDLVGRLKSDAAKKPAKDVFEDFLKSYWSYLMVTYPDWATYVGYPGQNGRLSDNSIARIRADKKNAEKLVMFLRGLKREKLEANQVTTYDLLLDKAQLEQQASVFPDELMPLNQLDSSPQGFVQLMTAMPRENLQDMTDRLSRLKAMARNIKNDQEKLVEGMKNGITVPFPAMQRVPTDLKKLTPADVTKSPYYTELNDWPKDVPAADRERVMTEAKKIIETEIYPAIREITRYVEKEYVPKTRRTIGLSDLPNGKAWYDLAVKTQTTTDMTADQVHELGLREVDRLAKGLDKVQAEMKFKGTRTEYLKFMRDDKKFRFKSQQDMLVQYREAAKRIDGEMPRMFGKLPRQPYGIKAVPDFMAESNAGAYYESGALTAGKAGMFMINTHLPKNQQWWEVESLTVHEAVPGHHLQIALSQEQDELPDIRKHDGYTAYSEGWALYAETLGYEMGLYKDPAMKFGQITNEIWRAVRLVVDTGMHAKGWSRQKAIDYMKSYVAKDERDIIVEIDRYIVWPGQALAYKVGQLKFTELRERAKKVLGENFSLRSFHDRCLDAGALPMRVLEARISDWIATEKAKPKVTP